MLGYLVHTLNSFEYPEPPAFTPKPKTVDGLIEYYADLYDADLNLVRAVAICESGLKENAQNAYSSAGGVFQYIDSTWEGYCDGNKMNAEDNIKCGVRMISEGGISHWSESQSCWSYKQFAFKK